MTPYTLYVFDAQGRASDFEEVFCATDAEAINTMLDRAQGRPIELWRGEQRLLSARAEGARRPGLSRRARPAPPTVVAQA